MEHVRMDDESKNKRIRLGTGEVVPSASHFVYTNETMKLDLYHVTNVRVDSSVSIISRFAFYCCTKLVQVELHATLTRIEQQAFSSCLNLSFVQFAASDASLEASSMRRISEDGLVVFPEQVTLQIEEEAFRCCYRIRKVIVCSVTTKLGRGVFHSCTGLVSVELPEGLQVIEEDLFSDCKSLTMVKIPQSVIKIGVSAFGGCQSLTLFDLPPGLLEISWYAFGRCVSIESMQIPATVSSLGMSAFNRCSMLKHIQLPLISEIDELLFYGCKRLESIEIPTTVQRIERSAFSDCSCLSHIRIPPGIDYVSSTAFTGCSSLLSIELPERISSPINLRGCHSLVNIAGPGGLNELAMEDFMQNSKLGSVVDRYDDLVYRLKHRFDDSPLNKLCYYQSYYSMEDAMVQLHNLLDEDPLAAVAQVDEFGMTPLHILSLSQSPNVDMLLALISAGHPDHVILWRDSFGSTPMDYLCLNKMPNATQVIRRVLQTRLDGLGLDQWKLDLLQAVDEALALDRRSTGLQFVNEALALDLSSRRTGIRRVYFKLASYERKEILSLVELCLWKVKIDEVVSFKKKDNIAHRESCRINSGAPIVIPHLLPFLDKLNDAEAYFARSLPFYQYRRLFL